MKKLFYLIQIPIFAVLLSSAAMADGYGWGRGHPGWGHHHHHHHRGWGGGWGGYGGGYSGYRGYGYRPQVNYYYAQPNYYQPPPVQYYPQPPVQYYPPQPHYNGGYYDNRSRQGLAGGVVGSVFGYELGNGHPLAAGVGAAAGSFLGNGMGWRY